MDVDIISPSNTQSSLMLTSSYDYEEEVAELRRLLYEKHRGTTHKKFNSIWSIYCVWYLTWSDTDVQLAAEFGSALLQENKDLELVISNRDSEIRVSVITSIDPIR